MKRKIYDDLLEWKNKWYGRTDFNCFSFNEGLRTSTACKPIALYPWMKHILHTSIYACIYQNRPIHLSFGLGDVGQLSATVRPDDASNKELVWTTSDSTVAKVDSHGKVNALKAGTAKIRAISTDGGGRISSYVNITVSDPGNEIPHVHSYENCIYKIEEASGHCRICNICGNPEELQAHDFVLRNLIIENYIQF